MKGALIVHLTSAHARYDTRIFLKQCRSLSDAGYQVELVVADGRSDEVRDGITIHDIGAPKGRLRRMFQTTRSVYKKAVDLDADVYQLHDPELIPVGIKLKKQGKTVIFDSHEDVTNQILSKPYLNRFMLKIISVVYSIYEKHACKKFDAILTATPTINRKFLSINSRSVNINNFPMLGELSTDLSADWQSRDTVCYVGGIAGIRGIREVVRAMEFVKQPTRLKLVGRFSSDGSEAEVRSQAGWGFVDQLGFLDRLALREVLARSFAGLVTFHPLPNHVDAQPNKMFEYMSAGVPVIGSNFPLWKEIIEGNDCGLCVDPLNPSEIAAAIGFLSSHPERVGEMGENGKRAVTERYNWDVEVKKLLDLYSMLINR